MPEFDFHFGTTLHNSPTYNFHITNIVIGRGGFLDSDPNN